MSSVVFAHHGWGGYRDWLEFDVVVIDLRLGNPHDRLVVKDKNGDEWNLLLAPPARNRRFGFNEESLHIGDKILLYGQKHPNRRELKVHCIYRESKTIYIYRYNSGRSSLERIGGTKKQC